LRAIIGHRNAVARKTEERFIRIEQDIQNIKESIASIAGRMMERDRHGNYTWPGDKS
jgi:hypothetical protein